MCDFTPGKTQTRTVATIPVGQAIQRHRTLPRTPEKNISTPQRCTGHARKTSDLTEPKIVQTPIEPLRARRRLNAFPLGDVRHVCHAHFLRAIAFVLTAKNSTTLAGVYPCSFSSINSKISSAVVMFSNSGSPACRDTLTRLPVFPLAAHNHTLTQGRMRFICTSVGSTTNRVQHNHTTVRRRTACAETSTSSSQWARCDTPRKRQTTQGLTRDDSCTNRQNQVPRARKFRALKI